MLLYTRRTKLIIPLDKKDIYYGNKISLQWLNLCDNFTQNGFIVTVKQSKHKTKKKIHKVFQSYKNMYLLLANHWLTKKT